MTARSIPAKAVIESASLAKASDADLLRLTPVNAEAFGVFYDRYEREVLAFFWRRTQRADLAADLTGEVFASALESAARFDADWGRSDLGGARGWLYTIARRQMADAWEHGRVENAARSRNSNAEPLLLTDEIIASSSNGSTRRSLRCLGCWTSFRKNSVSLSRAAWSTGTITRSCPRRLSVSQSVVRQRVGRGLRALRRRFDEPRPKENR